MLELDTASDESVERAAADVAQKFGKGMALALCCTWRGGMRCVYRWAAPDCRFLVLRALLFSNGNCAALADGCLWGIVNNAGIGFGRSLEETLATNAFGPYRVNNAFIPLGVRLLPLLNCMSVPTNPVRASKTRHALHAVAAAMSLSFALNFIRLRAGGDTRGNGFCHLVL